LGDRWRWPSHLQRRWRQGPGAGRQVDCGGAAGAAGIRGRVGHEKSQALTRNVRGATEPNGLAGAHRNTEGRPLEEVTVREITEITRKLGGKRGGAGRDAARLARDAQAALRKRAGTAVRVTTGRGGAFLIRLDATALRRLAALR
jgi:hypothetical protein